jgi:RNA polymerase sigma-70 factor (ECF subfamily)
MNGVLAKAKAASPAGCRIRSGRIRVLTRTRVCPNLADMTPEASDESLMTAYAQGDTSAFEVLYRRHRGTVYAFLMRSLGRRDQADDCFQDVWSRVITARTGYRVEARFTTWLLQIAHNLLIDRYRRQRPDVPLDALPDSSARLADDAPGPELGLSEFERHKQLRDAIAALPAEQRHAVLLRLDQELSLEDIGVITGVGRETVKSRLRYAMDKLRETLS